MSSDEKKATDDSIRPVYDTSGTASVDEREKELESHEVFQVTSEGVNFRTVSWQRASVIFLKVIFSTGVLSIPSAMFELGAVGGTLSIVAWQALNTYCGVIQGDFRNKHPECHTLADMGYVLGGPVLKEVIGVIYIVAYVLCTGGGMVTLSVAFNAFSDHSACTVWWTFISFVLITACSSVRTFQNIGWLTWAGFGSLLTAILIVVIAVTTRDRPFAAPQEGPFELGFHAVAYPGFAAGMTATATIFVSSAGTSAFIPVISEMRRPRDFYKAMYVCMGFVLAAYLAFSLVVYRWCGQWVASPSLGSAGGTMEKVSYGVGFLGLVVSGCLYNHVAAKYVFVRLLRGSRHLQSNTWVHWSTWLGCIISLGAVAFVLAEAIAIFNYLVALTGSLCFAPMAIMMPPLLWMYDHGHFRSGTLAQRTFYWLHVSIVVLGLFVMVGGTYAVILSIKDAYATGLVGSAFSCANNALV